jgi:peptide/nickel transport system ATP-binding protein
MTKTILSTKALKAFYILDVQGKQKVVKAVNEVELNIKENEIYGIAGESGCGKSTLLKALAAVIEPPLRQLGGKVVYHVNGKEVDVSTYGAEALRKLRWQYDSYVPQGSMSVMNPVINLKSNYR